MGRLALVAGLFVLCLIIHDIRPTGLTLACLLIQAACLGSMGTVRILDLFEEGQ